MKRVTFLEKEASWRSVHERATRCYRYIWDCIARKKDEHIIKIMKHHIGIDSDTKVELCISPTGTLLLQNKLYVYFAYHPEYKQAETFLYKRHSRHSTLRFWKFWEDIELPVEKEDEKRGGGGGGVFQMIPNNILAYVLLFCGCKTVYRVTHVCHQWRCVATDKYVWIPRLQAIGAPITNASCKTFFEFVMQSNQLYLIASAWLHLHGNNVKGKLVSYGLQILEPKTKRHKMDTVQNIALHYPTPVCDYLKGIEESDCVINAREMICLGDNKQGCIVWLTAHKHLKIASVKAKSGHVDNSFIWMERYLLPYCDLQCGIK